MPGAERCDLRWSGSRHPHRRYDGSTTTHRWGEAKASGVVARAPLSTTHPPLRHVTDFRALEHYLRSLFEDTNVDRSSRALIQIGSSSDLLGVVPAKEARPIDVDCLEHEPLHLAVHERPQPRGRRATQQWHPITSDLERGVPCSSVPTAGAP